MSKEHNSARPMTERQWKVICELRRRGKIDEESFANIEASRRAGEFTSAQATALINPHAEELGMKRIDTSKWKGEADGEGRGGQDGQATQEPACEDKPDDTSGSLPDLTDVELESHVSVRVRLGKATGWLTFPMTRSELDAAMDRLSGQYLDGYDACDLMDGDVTYERADVIAVDPRGLAGRIGLTVSQDESLLDINLMTLALRAPDDDLTYAEKLDAVALFSRCLGHDPGALEIASLASRAGELPYNGYDTDAPLPDGPDRIDRYAATLFAESDFPGLPDGGFRGMARGAVMELERAGEVMLGDHGYVRTVVDGHVRDLRTELACRDREELGCELLGPYEALRESFAGYVERVDPIDRPILSEMAQIAEDHPQLAARQLALAQAVYETQGRFDGPAVDVAACPDCERPLPERAVREERDARTRAR